MPPPPSLATVNVLTRSLLLLRSKANSSSVVDLSPLSSNATKCISCTTNNSNNIITRKTNDVIKLNSGKNEMTVVDPSLAKAFHNDDSSILFNTNNTNDNNLRAIATMLLNSSCSSSISKLSSSHQQLLLMPTNRSYSTSIRKDKYGRIIQRRVIRQRKQHKKQNENQKMEIQQPTHQEEKSLWPKLPKIITPTNVPLQHIPPPPNVNLRLTSKISKSSTKDNTSKSSAEIIESTSSTNSSNSELQTSLSSSSKKSSKSKSTANTTPMTPPPPTTTTSTTETISKEKTILSGSSTPIQQPTPSTTTLSSSTTIKTTSKATASSSTSTTIKPKRLSTWLKENSGTIILNIGSIASLMGFTRTDMLELRILSMTGSMSTIYYFLSRPPPLVTGPIIWSSIFLMTNLYMAYSILEERKGKTRAFTSDEEDVYEEHFLPYGVTPRQYEKLLNIVKIVKLKRGEVLIKKDDKFDAVYLVTSGSTSGMTALSRRVTAASSCKGNKDRLSAGDAGAWIGEFAFLELLSSLQHGGSKNGTSGKTSDENEETNGNDVVKVLATAAANVVLERTNSSPKSTVNSCDNNEQQQSPTPSQNSSPATHHKILHGKALLTYMATQDSIIYKWNFDELADLLNTSTELRLAITRAMTAAVVHKVVNLYVSKQDDESDRSLWTRWMNSINYSTEKIQQKEEEEEQDSDHKVILKRPGTVRVNVVQQVD